MTTRADAVALITAVGNQDADAAVDILADAHLNGCIATLATMLAGHVWQLLHTTAQHTDTTPTELLARYALDIAQEQPR